MQKIETKQVVGYMVLPGVVPRLKSLFGSGFSFIASMMATVLHTARLLPANHPYLNRANFGKFGIRHVFAEAGRNLVFDRKHLDQVFIYFTLLAGIVILALQCLLVVVSLAAKPVQAGAGMPFMGMFTTPSPTNDIALSLLDRVFGVPDMFGSAYAPAGNPLPFQAALHALLQFYSFALLLVGVLIFLYYVFVVIAETAQSGTPFGRRFSSIWAPIRLVVAIGLLVPVNWGLNSSQYIVLQAAKMGSGFATNAWYQFNQGMTNALGAPDSGMFARVKVPDSWPIVKFVMLARTCKLAYERLGITGSDGNPQTVEAYLVKYPYEMRQAYAAFGDDADVVSYEDAVAFYERGDVLIRFGVRDLEYYRDEPGAVFPFCGEILVNTSAKSNTGFNIGPWRVQDGYYSAIIGLWASSWTNDFARIAVHQFISDNREPCATDNMGVFQNACTTGITPEQVDYVRDTRQSEFEQAVIHARNAMIANASALALPQEIAERGWAGAGIWYNRIAEINGGFIGAVSLLPIPSLDPAPMAAVVNAKRTHDRNISMATMYEPRLSDGRAIEMPGLGGFESSKNREVANVLWGAYQILGNDNLYAPPEAAKKNNAFLDTVDQFLGINGLFSMRENVDIHPLVQLTALGKGIVDGAVRSLFTATLFSAGGGWAGAIDDKTMNAFAGKFQMATAVFKFVATLGLSVGFVLYYVIPFMPFMYFFFAVGSWVKTIFEAMVGAPLWALAHLRIDGDGLPGENAMPGYYLILEIFLRPILCVFGLVASLIIFAAMVKVLNGVFSLVVANLAGFDNNPCQVTTQGGDCTRTGNAIDYSNAGANAALAALLQFKRSTVDEFFFTILYAVIVYMLATGCFKMIDQVPAGIMRWLSAGVQTFGDQTGGDLEEFKKYTAIQAAAKASQLSDVIPDTARDLAAGITKVGRVDQGGSTVTPGRGQGRG